jgi:hypothetical protein
LAPSVRQLSFLDDLLGVQRIVEPQVFALEPSQLQQLLGKVVPLLSRMELEEMRVVLDHKDFEAALESDEPSSLNVSDALQVNFLAEFLGVHVFPEEKQAVLVFNVGLVVFFGLALVRVHVDEYEIFRCEYQRAFGLVEGLHENTVGLHNLPLPLFLTLSCIFDVFYVQALVLLHNTRVDGTPEESELVALACFGLPSGSELLLDIRVDALEQFALQLLVLDELEPVVRPLLQECLHPQTTVPLIRRLQILWPVVCPKTPI